MCFMLPRQLTPDAKYRRYLRNTLLLTSTSTRLLPVSLGCPLEKDWAFLRTPAGELNGYITL